MSITITPAHRACPLCRGTGSGIYNVQAEVSICEACHGDGRQPERPNDRVADYSRLGLVALDDSIAPEPAHQRSPAR